MYTDLRDYRAMYKIMFGYLSNGSNEDLPYVTNRVENAMLSLAGASREFELVEELLGSFRELVKVLYAKRIEYIESINDKDVKLPDDLKVIDSMLNLREYNPESFSKYLTQIFKDLAEAPFGCSVESVQHGLDTLSNSVNRAAFCENCFNAFKGFKAAITNIETEGKKSIISQWDIYKKPICEGSKYLVVNAATRVSDVFRDSPTISTSVIDIGNPKWFNQKSRSVLFVYSVDDVDQVIGMSPNDTCTYYDAIDKNIYTAFIQLFFDNVLHVDTQLKYVGNDFRPAYPMQDLVSDSERISEIVFKGNTKPVAIILTNNDDTIERNAIAYHELFPDISIWKLKAKGLVVKSGQ